MTSCCSTMKNLLEYDYMRESPNNKYSVVFNDIGFGNSKTQDIRDITFCPFCGVKL